MSETGTIEGKRIIIADDEDFIRKHLSKRLSGMGFLVSEASSGRQVLDLLSTDPDLILMDVRMPLIDGYETTRQIKSCSETEHIPIILLSALSTEEDISCGLNAGASEFLCKPVTFADIMESISRNLQAVQVS